MRGKSLFELWFLVVVALLLAGCGGEKTGLVSAGYSWQAAEEALNGAFEATNLARVELRNGNQVKAQEAAGQACSCATSWRERIEGGLVLSVPADALRWAQGIEEQACGVHKLALGLTR